MSVEIYYCTSLHKISQASSRGNSMLDAAIAFFVMAMIATLLGASEFAGMSKESGQTLLVLFLALSMLSLVASLAAGSGSSGNYKDPL